MSYVGLWLQISRKLGVNCIFGKVTSTAFNLFFVWFLCCSELFYFSEIKMDMFFS